jgi:hypothetical protein
MAVIIAGILAAVVVLVAGLPSDVSFGQALHLAGATGRLRALDFSFNLNETYTFWSGLILVGPHRRPVPDARLLRVRSEPGAALPDREVGKTRGASR